MRADKVFLWGLGCGLMLSLVSASAGELYMSPSGSGNQDGGSWQAALPYTGPESIEQAWEKLGPGDSLNLAAGEYPGGSITLKASGRGESDMRSIRGQVTDGAMPVFSGSWQRTDGQKGFTLFTVAAGSSWIGIENIAARNVRGFFSTATPGRVTGIRLRNIEVNGTRDAFVFRGGASAAKPESGSNDILVENVRVTGYTKRAFRIRDGVYNMTLTNCSADAGGKEWATEPFHMGFSVQGGSRGSGVYDHDITFVNCQSRHNYHDNGKNYWNADGFCAEGMAYNLTYIGCVASDNTDGGWDDKSENPLLVGCVAMRNKRDFRFWAKEPGALLYRCASLHPVKRGGNSSAVGLWTGGIVRLHKSTFIGQRPAFELSRYKASAEVEAALRAYLFDSVMACSDSNAADTRIVCENTAKLTLDQAAKIAPQLAEEATTDVGQLLDGVSADSGQGYHSSWRQEDYLAIGRKLQPLIQKEVRLLEAKPITLFGDKKPSGWYFSGWRNCRMVPVKNKGVDGSTAMAVMIKDQSKGGGATYRTKRAGADINLADRQAAVWDLTFKVNTNGNAALPIMAIKIYSLDKSQKTRELPLNGYVDASSSAWQQVSIPVKEFENGATFSTFAGFFIRATGSLQHPFLIDDVRLEPAAN